MSGKLNNKAALILGAAGKDNMGQVMARRFAQEGAKITSVDTKTSPSLSLLLSVVWHSGHCLGGTMTTQLNGLLISRIVTEMETHKALSLCSQGSDTLTILERLMHSCLKCKRACVLVAVVIFP